MDNKTHYNPWPLGHLPKELQRPDLDIIKSMGYEFNDPRDVVRIFENKVAEFSGSAFAVSVDCCTHAIELCLAWKLFNREIDEDTVLTIPNRTYVSVPLTILHLGCSLNFEDYEWSGIYTIKGSGEESPIIDAAVRWNESMYIDNTFMCLSFQIKKPIAIGRGGIILTDNYEAYKWLKYASYDGRDLNTPYDSDQHIKHLVGYHYYMTPEDAARGIILMDKVEFRGDSGNSTMYPDTYKMLGFDKIDKALMNEN